MCSTENDLELEDGEINDLEDGEIEDDEILPKQRRNQSSQDMLPPDRTQRCFPLHSDEPRYSRRRDGERVVGLIYDQPSHRQRGLLPTPSIPRQGNRFMNFDGRGRGYFMNARERGRPVFPDRERDTFGRGRQKRGAPRRPAPPRIRTPSPPGKPQDIDYEEKEKEDYDLLLRRHKLIQQKLESLERQEKAALDSDIDDSFIDIPVGDDEEGFITGSRVEHNVYYADGRDNYYDNEFSNRIGETLRLMRGINVHETLDGSLDDSADNNLEESRVFEPFKIKPRYPTIPSLQERSKIDVETRIERGPRGGGNLRCEPEQGKQNEGDYPRKSNNVGVRRGNEQGQSVGKRRRHRKSKLKKAVNKQQTPKQSPLTTKSSSPVDPHSELEARLVALASREVPAEAAARRKEPDRKVEVVDKQKRRRERLKVWQQRKKGYHLKQEKGGMVASLTGASLDEYKHDDYLEMPMDVESDTADGPALPLIEEPAGDFPPPLPPREVGLDFMLMTEQGTRQIPMMMQGGYDPYLPDPQTYPGWMSAGPLPVPLQSNHQVYIRPDSASPSRQTTESTESVSIKPESGEGNDDDDEVALRQLLLKSMAKKKKEKQVEQSHGLKSPNTSVQNTPRSQSPVTATVGNSSTKLAKGLVKPTQMISSAPPQHDPVVIKLGEDSESDYSDEEKPADSTSAAEKDKLFVGLFGGLEMMIKETRKSVEASRVKPTQKDVEKIPPHPKTPDAMQHMPEDRKEEYRRLKEQLALHEKKRQPLSTVNLDKDEADREQTPDVNHLTVLQNQVTECDVALTKHRKVIEQDQSFLSIMQNKLIEQTSMLASQEMQVKRLQLQLQTAKGAVLASRMLIRKLQDQSTTFKNKLTKNLPVSSKMEEELLRAKTILSIARKTAMTHENDRGAEGEGNENREVFSPATVQEMTTALEARLRQLCKLTKSDMSSLNKRKLEDTDKEAAKKSRTEKGSQGNSASSTPRKSAMSERIAVEKARLKKLEKQLTDRLKQFGKDTESKEMSNEERKPNAAGKANNDNNTGGIKRKEATGANANLPKTEVVKEQHDESYEKMEVRKSEVGDDGSKAVGSELDIDTKQRDYVKMLQEEKEKGGPPFPTSSLHLPLAVHHQSAVCVWLQSTSLVEALETPDNTYGRFLESLSINPCSPSAKEAVVEDDGPPVPIPKQYRSPLLCFKSYRLSAYFRLREELSLSSLSHTNKVHPFCPLCKYDLMGVCNDEECGLQHISQCKPTNDEILQDIAAYDNYLFQDARDPVKVRERITSFTVSFAKQYQDKMTWDELCLLLVNRVKENRRLKGPHSIFHKPRPWRPEFSVKDKPAPEQKKVQDKGRGVAFLGKQNKGSLGKQARKSRSRLLGPSHEKESQEVRYFSGEYDSIKTLEEALQETPDNAILWVKLARARLNHKESADGEGNRAVADKAAADQSNIVQALNTLSRGLEANADSEELWLEYLQLFSTQSTYEELRDVCEQAVTFSPAYHVWRQCLDLSRTYADKRAICIRLLAFFSENPDVDQQLNSHRLLDTLLFLVQLNSYSGRHKTALADLQGALGRKRLHNMEVVLDLTPHFTPSDLCYAWLCYIHVFEFHRLPAPWFDPACSRPSSMVSKDEFVFPWQPGKGSRAPDDKLLGMFQDALKVCRKQTLDPGDRLAVCMPLYKNLIALERAYNRVDSAKGICQRLLREGPRRGELWLCLAALDEITAMKEDAAQVYANGLRNCVWHAEIAHSVARFHLGQNDSVKAVDALVKCVYSKFAASPGEEGEPLSLADSSSSAHGFPEPLPLYRKLLSQPLPYNYKCPPLMPGVVPKNLGTEEVYLWLCYCLLVELSPDTGHVSVESLFETVLHSLTSQKDRQRLWLEYLLYQRFNILRAKPSSHESQVKVMKELVNRCLVSESSSSSIPHSTAGIWHNYTFHNQVISLYLSCVPRGMWSTVFAKLLSRSSFPDNVNLALRASQHEMDMKNNEKARQICLSFLAENTSNITMWKVLIAIQLQQGCIKEARKLYQQATEALPFAATLWKDFAMFEIARGDDSGAVKEIAKKCQDIGVDISEFLTTLMGK